MALDKLPEPTLVHDMSKPGATWRAHLAGVGGMGIGVVNSIVVRAGHNEGLKVVFQDKKGLAIRNGGVYSQITYINDGSASPSPAPTAADPSPTVSGEAKLSALGVQRQRDEAVARPESAATSQPTISDAPPTFATTGAIPYGRADLLLGIDILEAARAIDPREAFRVASADRTAAVLNTHKQPTVYTLLGKQDFDPEALRQEIFDACRADLSFAKNLSMLCEERLGSKQFMNIMMLGVAYQLGLIPVSAHSIAWAIKDSIRRDRRRNLKAFNIGRKIALEPRALPNRPQAETWEQLLTNKGRVLRKEPIFKGSKPEVFEGLVRGAMLKMRDLPEPAKYDVAIRVYDLMQYQDDAYAREYLDRIKSIYSRDNADRGFAATRAAIRGVAKTMLIKDEPYVAYLLTRYEKKVRDIAKFNVDESNGDRIVYRHHTSPEFNVGKQRIRLRITTSDWQLKIVRHMKWWRKLPGWHARETAFRAWYAGLLDRVTLATDAGYEQALRVLNCVTDVTGYREIRYPKMDQARADVDAELRVGQAAGATGSFNAEDLVGVTA